MGASAHKRVPVANPQEEPEEGGLAIKEIKEEPGGDPGDSRRDGVSCNDQIELGRADVHDAHVLGAQRQDDQKIEVDGKLDGCQEQQGQSLIL